MTFLIQNHLECIQLPMIPSRCFGCAKTMPPVAHRMHGLRKEISQALPGVQLPVTLVFDYPSVSAMTELIMQSTGGAAIGN